jgi:hypothetical protein
MKKMKTLILLGVIGFAGIFSTSIQAMKIAEPNSWTAWYRKTYVSDYLPSWMRSWIPQTRVRDMFTGTLSYMYRVDNPRWAKAKADKFATDYIQWIQQYKDIINEGSFITPDSIRLGIPDTILGFWRGGRLGVYANKDFAQNKFLMDGINHIIKNLEEQLGARLNSVEKSTIEPIEQLYWKNLLLNW